MKIVFLSISGELKGRSKKLYDSFLNHGFDVCHKKISDEYTEKEQVTYYFDEACDIDVSVFNSIVKTTV